MYSNFRISLLIPVVFLLVLFSLTDVKGQDVKKYKLDEVVVSAGRTPISISNLTRNVEILRLEEIENAPVNNLQDLLQYIPGLNLRQRGPEGVQADISMRGGTFEQTLIMIDGIKVNDPQTGHHNLNIPINLEGIDRIEVLKGQGSKTFGPNAFSGAINIITKKYSETSLSLKTSGGSYGYLSNSINGSLNSGKITNNASFGWSRSDGYKSNTEFENLNFTIGSRLSLANGIVDAYFGFNEKSFGANSFYTSRFPDQAEATRTKFLKLSAEYNISSISLSPKLYWRNNHDVFVLDKNNHSFYRNEHKTDVFGAELQASMKTSLGTSVLGTEFTRDVISSNNLGHRNKNTYGLFFEQNININKKLTILAGGFVYKYPQIGWKVWPGLDLGYKLTEILNLYGSVGKAFRLPTYTDLYYTDPAVQGDLQLNHEEMLNYEIGFRAINDNYLFNLTLFRKEGSDIIDWVLNTSDSTWYSTNFAEINTTGLEVSFNYNPGISFISKVGFGYTYLNSDKDTKGLQSRYAFEQLKHQVNFSAHFSFIENSNLGIFLRFEDKENFDDTFVVDANLSQSINNFKVFLKATNLLNTSQKDFAGVDLPGRWLYAGASFRIVGK